MGWDLLGWMLEDRGCLQCDSFIGVMCVVLKSCCKFEISSLGSRTNAQS